MALQVLHQALLRIASQLPAPLPFCSGFYDRKKLFWMEVEGVTLCGAAGPSGGARSELPPRLARHFTPLCLPPPPDAAMRAIFSAIWGGFLNQHFPPGRPTAETTCIAVVESTHACIPVGIPMLQTFAVASYSRWGDRAMPVAGAQHDPHADVRAVMQRPVVDSAIAVYTRLTAELLPTPTKSHYTFNLRDVSKVFQVGAPRYLQWPSAWLAKRRRCCEAASSQVMPAWAPQALHHELSHLLQRPLVSVAPPAQEIRVPCPQLPNC
jgi:hypothetical protein